MKQIIGLLGFTCLSRFSFTAATTENLVKSNDSFLDAVEPHPANIPGECQASDGTCSKQEDIPPDACDTDELCHDRLDTCNDIIGRFSSRAEACIDMFNDMRHDCRKSCQFCGSHTETRALNIYSAKGQVMKGKVGGEETEVWEHNAKVDQYMYDRVYVEDSFASVKKECINHHELCVFWAHFGQCAKFPTYMKMQCAPACFSCDYLLFEERCAFDDKEPVAWSKMGDLDRTFTTIIKNSEFQNYNPQIMSRPDASRKGNGIWSSIGRLFGNKKRSDNGSPWIVALDNFLTPSECQVLLELGVARENENSVNEGDHELSEETNSDSSARAPAASWCTRKCADHPTVKAVQERVGELVKIPSENFEFFRFLKYDEGQFDGPRHGYMPNEKERFQGPRVLSVFLFLNDVEGGGGIDFPQLNNVTVQPKQGRAVVWHSVLHDDVFEKDGRTEYQVLTVVAGTEYGISTWVHQRNYKDTWAKWCT